MSTRNPPIQDLMKDQLITVDADARVSEARELMDASEIRHLPVLEQGKLH